MNAKCFASTAEYTAIGNPPPTTARQSLLGWNSKSKDARLTVLLALLV